MIAYLSLGSNLGDRGEHLRRAIAELPGVRKTSSIYETEPADFVHQPWFLNCVVEVETDLPPVEFLHSLQAIERKHGRVRKTPSGPRTLDIDILFYGDQTISTPELTVPHPRLAARRFVLEPLAEIAPRFRPMLDQTPDHLSVRKVP